MDSHRSRCAEVELPHTPPPAPSHPGARGNEGWPLPPPRCAPPLPPPIPQRLALVALPQRPGGGAHPSGCPAGRVQPLATSADPCVLGDPGETLSPANSGGQTSPGAAGRQEGWLPQSAFTWSCGPGTPGALARRCPRGLQRATHRPASPGAGKPVPSCPRPSAPLVSPRGGVTAPRSPAAPTAGAAPPSAPPGSRLPTSGLPGSPPPPHHMAAPATGSRRKPEAAVTPPPPPLPPRGGGRSPRLSSRGGHGAGPAGPGQGCTLAAAPARPGGLHALLAPEEGAGLSAPKGSSAKP